ncbi:hypothetical protein CN03_07255 [Thalassolituus oleivorans]|uniref:beta-galactosidase n=1 Tax=Thalassolituus oleivorans TaxID=187493 RepID=UPI000949430E|nr:beta-galactosidase [Thalassolituus oleivorans]APR66751.1 hypothetical protein CN03_07255 [Thalassolituus oleivorans]
MQTLNNKISNKTPFKNASDALTSILFLVLSSLLLVGCGGGSAPIDLNPPSNSNDTPTTDPVVTDPVVTDPVVTDPVVTDPVVTDPVVTDPVVTDPVVTDPVVEPTYKVTGTFCSCGPTSQTNSSINRDTENLDYLDGVLVRISWADMNPQAGIYDWSYLDEQIGYAEQRNTKIALAILNGPYAPTWLAEEGATMFEYTLRGNVVSLPLPWDTVYLSYYQAFIEELGARYSGNEFIDLVHITNSTTNGFEMQYTFNSAQITDFETAGYTEELLINSWTTIIDAYATAFPNKPIDVEVHPVFFSDKIATDVVDHGLALYGKRFGVLAAWWSEHNAKNVYTSMFTILKNVQKESFAGVQLVGAVSTGLNPLTEEQLAAALQLAIDNGFYYMEIWNNDLANTQLSDLITNNDNLIEAQTAVQ